MAVGCFKNYFDKRTREEVMISTPKVEGTTLQRCRLKVTTKDDTKIPTLLPPGWSSRFSL